MMFASRWQVYSPSFRHFPHIAFGRDSTTIWACVWPPPGGKACPIELVSHLFIGVFPMKARWIVFALCGAVLLVAGQFTVAKDEPAAKKFAATCPVSGQPAVESAVVEIASGEKAYFCCENCPKAYKANPEKFALQVSRQLLETGQIVQVACPISGKPVNKEATVEVGQAKAGFCCKNCLAKYNAADDEGKLKCLFADEKKGFTHQTMCPVSGKPINPEASAEYKNEKVYFCCPGCPDAFKADPDKYLAKLPQFAKDNEAKK